MGSNMAECHPVAFRWPMKAKMNGAKIIHVDPRFTRTSAVADFHVPIRAGSDIAFLGGLINYVVHSERWNKDPFFKDYTVHYTNLATIVNEEFKDTEDLDGVFSGLVGYKEPDFWPFNGFLGRYDNKTWQYERGPKPAGPTTEEIIKKRGSFDDLLRSLRKGTAKTDPTLQHPRCVFQLLKKHYSRYTPEIVEQICGCPKEKFLKVAETLLENSGRDRTTAFAYAVAWTQHTYGVQIISCCALLEQLTGNMGRPGGGIMALRGHAAIQGSTDVPTLYHSIHGYMNAPSAVRPHDTLRDYVAAETPPTGYWANGPKWMVSYLKSVYGDAATPENDFGYDWHPKILGDHSHIACFAAMAEGKIKGAVVVGQNPATSLNGTATRLALRQLDWLVVKDNWLTETATHWYLGPEVKNGEAKIADIKTEIFFFPSTQIAEYDGSFTNTQRMLQWHSMAAKAPGDCRTDSWFYHNLAKRLKKAYAGSKLPRDEGWNKVTWDFDPDPGETPLYPGEISALKVLREINGYQTADPKQHLKGFGELKDDGSTTCASWIYCGCFPAWDQNLTARREPDPPGVPGAHLKWGWAWPANRRNIYNRASADLNGNPWSERKRWVWWDPNFVNPPDPKTGKPIPRGKWVGYDVPDFTPTMAPSHKGNPDGIIMEPISGTDAFIMRPEGKGWIFVPAGLVDGPFPTHYEPHESPVQNLLYPKQQSSPVHKVWSQGKPWNQLAAPVGDPKYPYVISTYRLTEHYLAGAMSRWLPWLAELQPELFIELGKDLAKEKGIKNLDWVVISTPRSHIRAKALVTDRIGVMKVAGKTIHHVGMPWHWGWMGLSTGDVVNDLTAWVGDPNVSIHEGKAFVCNVEKA
jgi:formate dehydrogenase major subunit